MPERAGEGNRNQGLARLSKQRMQTRAYAICRRCAAVFPEGRRCPGCDGDAEAARQIAAATAHAVEAARPVRTRTHPRSAIFVTGILAISLITGLGMLVMTFV
jgi:hypothetical protein